MQRDLVVVLVHHRQHVQAARQPERRLHLLPVLERGVLELEMAEDVVRLQRELLLRPDEMEMAVASARRQFQLRLGIVAVDLRRERTLRGLHGIHYADAADAAVYYGFGKAYFFSGDTYVRYEVGSNGPEGVEAGATWPRRS